MYADSVAHVSDPNALLAYVVEGTRARYERIDVPSLVEHRIVEVPSSNVEWSFDEGGGTLAYLGQTPTAPSDLWAIRSP